MSITPLSQFSAPSGSTSVALGFFDGFHRGHQAIVGEARSGPGRALTFTFRNHPATVISSQRAPELLTTVEERFALLSEAGTEVVWCDFDRPFSQLSPQEFFHDVLVGRLGAGRLVSGGNYRFGHRAEGDVALLRQLAAPLNIEVVCPSEVVHEGQWISSTRIREAVRLGRVEEAAGLLGRPFSLSARVSRGDQRGRQLGFPTANLPLSAGQIVPAFGVYACWVRRGQQRFAAVANLGIRPTVTESRVPLLEVHLFDFAGDLYGESLGVELRHFLRPEQKFSGLEALKHQIEVDSQDARTRLLGSP